MSDSFALRAYSPRGLSFFPSCGIKRRFPPASRQPVHVCDCVTCARAHAADLSARINLLSAICGSAFRVGTRNLSLSLSLSLFLAVGFLLPVSFRRAIELNDNARRKPHAASLNARRRRAVKSPDNCSENIRPAKARETGGGKSKIKTRR